jgi:hypothetical protein
VELERRLVKIPNYFENDPPRHHHHIRERRLVEQHKRARSQSSDGTRDWNGGAYGVVDEGDDQEKISFIS